MSKIALFNFVTDNVNYVKGKVYSNEEVAHLDQTNFKDTEAQVAVEETVVETKINTESTEELDSEEKETVEEVKKDVDLEEEKKEGDTEELDSEEEDGKGDL